MAISMVGMIVLHGKVYIPTLAETPSGLLIQVDPVFECEIQAEILVDVIEKLISLPRPQVHDLTREEWKKRKDPVLRATKTKSWNELAQNGASFGLEWTNKGIKLDIPRLDQRGRWEVDPSSITIFPLNTQLLDIVNVIIEKINSRPELTVS